MERLASADTATTVRVTERRRPEAAAPSFERQVDDHAHPWAALARLSPPHRA